MDVVTRAELESKLHQWEELANETIGRLDEIAGTRISATATTERAMDVLKEQQAATAFVATKLREMLLS